MARYGIAVAIGCLYVAGAALIVGSEGEAYRSDLRHQREAAANPSRPPKLLEADAAGPKTDAAAPPPKIDNATEVKTPSPGVEVVAPSTLQPSDGAGRKQLASTKPMVAEPKPTPPPGGTPKDEPTESVEPGILWADTLDLSKLNAQDERRLGGELHRMIMNYNAAWVDNTLEQRVEEVAEPLLKLRSRKDIEYTFTLLDSPVLNAFSHPGGYIYLSRGLLLYLVGENEDFGEDEKCTLQFVLGDEIAHVDFGHALKCVEPANQKEKEKGLGTVAQFYFLIALGYPDSMVFEADQWVAKRMMVDLDRSRHETLAFMRMFEGYANSHGFGKGRQLPAPSASDPADKAGTPPPSIVENHFRALTSARRRLSELKSITESLAKPVVILPK